MCKHIHTRLRMHAYTGLMPPTAAALASVNTHRRGVFKAGDNWEQNLRKMSEPISGCVYTRVNNANIVYTRTYTHTHKHMYVGQQVYATLYVSVWVCMYTCIRGNMEELRRLSASYKDTHILYEHIRSYARTYIHVQ
jgi:hypothetical protein